MYNIFFIILTTTLNSKIKRTLPNLKQIGECSFSSFMPGKSYETGLHSHY